jgi:hypothetical protein
MPWCASCERYLSPSTVRVDATCPGCGRAVDPGGAHSEPAVADDDAPPMPWHLWLLLAALAVYLGYRAFQGVEWLFGI